MKIQQTKIVKHYPLRFYVQHAYTMNADKRGGNILKGKTPDARANDFKKLFPPDAWSDCGTFLLFRATKTIFNNN